MTINVKELEERDNKDKKWVEECIKKHNVKLEVFNFLDKNFQKRFNDYKNRLNKYFFNDDNKEIDKDGRTIWFANSYASDLIEYYSMTQHQYPDFLKNFLNKFVKTNFYKRKYEEYKDFYPDYADYCYANWQTNGNRHFNTDFDDINNLFQDWAVFGAIPRYQYDTLCAIQIDFKNKKAEVVRGYAVAPYASRVLKKYYPVPKYMKPIVEELFEEFEKWKEENCYENN